MYLLFFLIYTVADPFMVMTENVVKALGDLLFGGMAEGPLKDLLLDGVIGGVGGTLVFVPQIAMLFLLISIMEESGYLARSAFLLDRLLAAVGLHGKSFVPMLSSHACAIPGVMASRSIESPRDRLATVLVVPFMSCGARLPVYTLLIGVFLRPYGAVVESLTLFGCYTLGIIAAVLVSLLLKKTALPESGSEFLLELPHYQWPQPVQLLRVVLRNSWRFVHRAFTIILGFSILLWAGIYYPQLKESHKQDLVHQAGFTPESWKAVLVQKELKEGVSQEDRDRISALQSKLKGEQIAGSVVGTLGHWLEPVIAPLGYDWKIGVGLIGAFAAREVFVSTMGVVYSVGEADQDSHDLHQAMRDDRRIDGKPLWTLPVVLGVLAFFVLAMQCISTVAVVRQETGGWKWPLIQLVGMNVIAYIVAMLIYQIGTAMGA